MNWTDIIKTVATNTVFLAVLGFVAKSIFNHFLSKNIDRYRIELQVTSERELEKLRAELNRVAFENQIRFTKLHEKRADVIENLYHLIIKSEEKCKESIQNQKKITEKELYEKVSSVTKELKTYLIDNRIYLESALCEKLEFLIQKLEEISAKFYVSRMDLEYLDKQQMWNDAIRDYLNRVPEIREEIENKFRAMLGV